MNHGGRRSSSASPLLVTPTRKKKSFSLKKRLSPVPPGISKSRSSQVLLPSPKVRDSRSSRRIKTPKGKSVSPTPGTPSQRSKARSIKNFLMSPLKTPSKARSGSGLEDMRDAFVALHPLPDEGSNQVNARTVRVPRTKKKPKSESSAEKPRSFKELLEQSHAAPTHPRSADRGDTRAYSDASLSPAEISKPLSAGLLISGLLESVGHMVENFLDDDYSDDGQEGVSRFDNRVTRLADWAG